MSKFEKCLTNCPRLTSRIRVHPQWTLKAGLGLFSQPGELVKAVDIVARGGRFVQLEGNERPRNVVAKFPSVDAAVECYHSAEYQEALSHARGASERELMVVETSE